MSDNRAGEAAQAIQNLHDEAAARITGTGPDRPKLTGPIAYEDGAWWLEQADQAAKDAMRLEGEAGEIHLRGQATLYANVASAYFRAASVAAQVQLSDQQYRLTEAEREDWAAVLGS